MSFARVTPHPLSRSAVSTNVSEATRRDAKPASPPTDMGVIEEFQQLSNKIKRLDKSIKKMGGETPSNPIPGYAEVLAKMKSDRASLARRRSSLSEKVVAIRLELANGNGGVGAINEMRHAMVSMNRRLAEIQDGIAEIRQILATKGDLP